MKKLKKWTPKSPKEVALEIKSLSNAIVQDFNYASNVTELTILYALISYMDTFLLKCLDDNEKITNRRWITMRLFEADLILKVSKSPEVQDIVKKIELLSNMLEN